MNTHAAQFTAVYDRAIAGVEAKVQEALVRNGGLYVQVATECVAQKRALRATWRFPKDSRTFESIGRVTAELKSFGHEKVRMNVDRQNVAIFVSQHEHCLRELLLQHQHGELDCEIRCVVSNHPTCRQLVNEFGLPFYYVETKGQSKCAVEAQQLEILKSLDVELIVLARYMQILSPEFVAKFHERIINIHHSLLPAFPGADPYAKALERGVKCIGATAHYVTAELDAGPIIEQRQERITHRDDKETLRRKGAVLETEALVTAVDLHLAQRTVVVDHRVVVFESHATESFNWLARGWPNDWLSNEWPGEVLMAAHPEVYGADAAWRKTTARREAA